MFVEDKALIKILASPKKYRKLAITILNNGMSGDLRDSIKQLIFVDGDLDYIYRLIYLLGWDGTIESMNIIKRGMEHPSRYIREACGFMLGQLNEEENSAVLIGHLTDESKKVRNMVANAVIWAGGEFHIEIIEKQVKEKKINNSALVHYVTSKIKL